jgi:dihydropteroate synthase
MALLQTEKMLTDGAFFIDIGAASSKPGSPIIKPEVELKKLLPILQALINQFSKTHFSIDTYNSKVAKEALSMGASMINDISAGRIDPEMFKTVANFRVPYVLMHMQGTPKTMQEQPQYDNITQEIKFDLIQQIQDANAQGITDLIIDPGFGFGKNIVHNYQLLRELNSLTDLNCPILVGVSRKSMIYKVLKTGPDMALNGTTVLHAWVLERGASILRVHDVKEAKECIDLWTALQ